MVRRDVACVSEKNQTQHLIDNITMKWVYGYKCSLKLFLFVKQTSKLCSVLISSCQSMSGERLLKSENTINPQNKEA